VEPLADARGTLGFRGTPVENHCSTLSLPPHSKFLDLLLMLVRRFNLNLAVQCYNCGHWSSIVCVGEQSDLPLFAASRHTISPISLHPIACKLLLISSNVVCNGVQKDMTERFVKLNEEYRQNKVSMVFIFHYVDYSLLQYK